MFRRIVSATVVLVVCVGIAMADEIRGVITKVEGDKVTFAPTKKGEKGPEKTMSVASNVKVVKGKFNKETKSFEAAGDIEGGLKAKMFSNIGEKGVPAQIVTEGDKITEIRVMGGRKKKE